MDRLTLADRVVRFGAPGGFLITSLLHPTPGLDATHELSHASELWIGIHVIQILLIAGLGATVRRMLAGVDGGAARIARGATYPFVAVYASFDALVGLGIGVLALRAADASGAERQALLEAGDAIALHPIALLLTAGGVLAWLVATLGAACALRPTAPATVRVGLAAAGVLFGLSHVGPAGFAGAAALVLAAHAQTRHAPWSVTRDSTQHGGWEVTA